MKKLLIFLFVAAALCGCDEVDSHDPQLAKPARMESHDVTIWHSADISMHRIDGHLYLVGSVDFVRSQGGVRCIVHAESCPCKSETKKE